MASIHIPFSSSYPVSFDQLFSFRDAFLPMDSTNIPFIPFIPKKLILLYRGDRLGVRHCDPDATISASVLTGILTERKSLSHKAQAHRIEFPIDPGVLIGDPPGIRTQNHRIKSWSSSLCTGYHVEQKSRVCSLFGSQVVRCVIAATLTSILTCSFEPSSESRFRVHLDSVDLKFERLDSISPVYVVHGCRKRDYRDFRDYARNHGHFSDRETGYGRTRKRDFGIFVDFIGYSVSSAALKTAYRALCDFASAFLFTRANVHLKMEESAGVCWQTINNNVPLAHGGLSTEARPRRMRLGWNTALRRCFMCAMLQGIQLNNGLTSPSGKWSTPFWASLLSSPVSVNADPMRSPAHRLSCALRFGSAFLLFRDRLVSHLHPRRAQ